MRRRHPVESGYQNWRIWKASLRLLPGVTTFQLRDLDDEGARIDALTLRAAGESARAGASRRDTAKLFGSIGQSTGYGVVFTRCWIVWTDEALKAQAAPYDSRSSAR